MATKAGQVQAFAELVRRYQQKLLRYGQRFLPVPEDAEDAVQDTLMKAYQNIGGFRSGQRFSPWIYRIAHNTFISIIRSKKREPVPFFDADTLFPHPIAEDVSDQSADIAMVRQQLDRGLAKLDAKYREILILRFDQDLSYAEIADILHVPMGTVSVRLKRAINHIKEHVRHD